MADEPWPMVWPLCHSMFENKKKKVEGFVKCFELVIVAFYICAIE